MTDQPPSLTISEVCKALRRSRTFVWNLRKRGVLKPLECDNHRFPAEHVMALAKANSTTTPSS